MILRQWAARHGINIFALIELERMLGVTAESNIKEQGLVGSESRQQSLIRLEAAQKDVYLFRNNVGALTDKRGVPVRYGLANESSKQNETLKSADLIGFRPVVIGPEHVGMKFALFVSVEVKEEKWQYSGDDHEVAQRNWMEFVLSHGGQAMFATGPGKL